MPVKVRLKVFLNKVCLISICTNRLLTTPDLYLTDPQIRIMTLLSP